MPASFIQSLHTLQHLDVAAFEEVHASNRQVTSIRVHPEKKLPEESVVAALQTKEVPWCSLGRYLKERPSFTLDPALHAGAYYVQEASSMFLWKVLQQTVGEATNGMRILDACAAPGGKSTLLASYFKESCIVSNEVIKTRANILSENITKWGSTNVVVTNNDPSHFSALRGFFDVIVIDAPCSGSGLFRKDADAIKEWSENNVALCSQRQERILGDVIPCLKEGGILIYSTCSYSMAEDEAIADYVLQFPFVTCKIENTAADNIIETTSPKKSAYGYRFYPHLLMGEGLYMAAFKKTDGDFASFYKEKKLPTVSKTEQEQASGWVSGLEHFSLFKQGDAIKVVPSHIYADLLVLSQVLYIKKAGIEAGTIKGKDLIPHHELALSTLSLTNINKEVLSTEDALQYLRRKDLVIQPKQTGWTLMTWCGLSLGWAKVLPNRLNNYYPQEWRILKG